MGLRDWIDRAKISNVQDDPEWQLAASLGDMEFEQDMYDDLQGDEDALRGLRKHAKEGLGRYADWFPLRDKKNIISKLIPVGEGYHMGQEHGSYEPEAGYRPGPDNDPDLIDINMLNLLRDEDKLNEMVEGVMLDDEELVPGSLQDKISDIYRHEYKHAAGLGHPEIYKQWYKNLDPSTMIGDYEMDYYKDYNKGGIVSLVR
jgi:hypothetical protein